MTLKIQHCPECGADIKFSYVTPERAFRIDEHGQIRRDDAWKGPDYDNSYFHFYCSTDKEHDLQDEESFHKWMEDVEDATLTQNLSA